MDSAKNKLLQRTWTKADYLVSTNTALIPISELNEVFASEVIHWADSLPEDVMRETLENSLCFGLYEVPETGKPADPSLPPAALEFIGFARCVTDFTTFVYLTDVYVDPACQGKGLGAWLIGCVQDAIESMPYLRRSMLFTSDWDRSVPFYEKRMGMSVVECKGRVDGHCGEGPAIMQRLGPAFPSDLR